MKLPFSHRSGGVSVGVIIVCIVCVLLGGIIGSIMTQQVMLHQAETLLSDREQYPRLSSYETAPDRAQSPKLTADC